MSIFNILEYGYFGTLIRVLLINVLLTCRSIPISRNIIHYVIFQTVNYYPGTEQQPYHQCHLICQVRLRKNSMPNMVIQSYPEFTEITDNDVTVDDRMIDRPFWWPAGLINYFFNFFLPFKQLYFITTWSNVSPSI